jgi:hypothetical protein
MLGCIVLSANKSSTSPYTNTYLFPVIIPISLIVNKNLDKNQIIILSGHRSNKETHPQKEPALHPTCSRYMQIAVENKGLNSNKALSIVLRRCCVIFLQYLNISEKKIQKHVNIYTPDY